MNKLFFIFVFFGVNLIWAVEPVEIIFSQRTNLKMGETHRIRVVGEKIFFDAEQIDPVQILRATSALKALANTQQDKDIACPSGTYFHSVKKNKTLSQVKGCMSSPRAIELVQSINQFQNLHLLKK